MRRWRSAEASTVLKGGECKIIADPDRNMQEKLPACEGSMSGTRRAQNCAGIGERSLSDPLSIGPARWDLLTSTIGGCEITQRLPLAQFGAIAGRAKGAHLKCDPSR
ncbi:hypothetical protein VNPA131463_60160 [Pseudomonas aeruginosa]|nr:hypothetical protein VNPA131463_60160 [Pseudomonas aeruginosa]